MDKRIIFLIKSKDLLHLLYGIKENFLFD